MHILKRTLQALLCFLAAAALAVAVSSLAEKDSGDVLLSAAGFRLTATGAGAFLAFLVFLLFFLLWAAESRKMKRGTADSGEWLNGAGFGILPAAAVWKAFEHATSLGAGIPIPDPIPVIPFLSSGECFAVSRTEMVLSVICFFILAVWLIARKNDLPRNDDLFWITVCIWGMTRAWTEGFRRFPLLYAGSVNLSRVLFLAGADLSLLVWTIRTGKIQKSTVFTVLEWIAVLGCETVILLNSSGILTMGSGIGDMAVNTGCTVLCMLLMLLAGKDARN